MEWELQLGRSVCNLVMLYLVDGRFFRRKWRKVRTKPRTVDTAYYLPLCMILQWPRGLTLKETK